MFGHCLVEASTFLDSGIVQEESTTSQKLPNCDVLRFKADEYKKLNFKLNWSNILFVILLHNFSAFIWKQDEYNDLTVGICSGIILTKIDRNRYDKYNDVGILTVHPWMYVS